MFLQEVLQGNFVIILILLQQTFILLFISLIFKYLKEFIKTLFSILNIISSINEIFRQCINQKYQQPPEDDQN